MLLINILNITFIIFIILHFINKNHFIENLETQEITETPENTNKSIKKTWEDLYTKYLLFEKKIKYYISDNNKQRFKDARDNELNNITDDSNATAKNVANTSIKNKNV